ncbi:MAG: FCD domain-containing protein [Actinobacteria bacterium]|nr:FCD domain-containing protein [Actinomycetota bacterium]
MAEAVWRVYEDLKVRIVNGTYPAGERLRETSLAVELGVSRTPVREALQRLQAAGLVEISPNRGARVTGIAGADVDDIFDLRTLLESYAARRAAENGVADLDHFRGQCAAMEACLAASDGLWSDDVAELNQAFHKAIHTAADNTLLPGALSGVVQMSLVRHTFHHYTKNELERSFAQHRELVDAIDARDGPWAESVMRSHLHAARASLRRHTTEHTDNEGMNP